MKASPGDRVKFISCEIIFREACKLAAASPLRVDVEFHPKGLHDLVTTDMRARLQGAIDAADADGRYRAVLLGYARCNDGVVGLTARSTPLVIPKAHDCITLFFGSRAGYQGYFDAHPGTYFHTTGWRERNDSPAPGAAEGGVMSQLGLSMTHEQLVAKYGQDNADYVREMMGDWTTNYSRLCYIEMGVIDERAHIAASRTEAERKGWAFDCRDGDWSLLERLFSGDWDEDFVIVPPGHAIVPRNDAEVLGCEGPPAART